MADKLILASSSPRRIELLQNCRIPFDVVEHNFNEDSINVKNPIKFAKLLAKGKAVSIANLSEYNNDYVLGVDTIVVIKNKILGKPGDKKEAKTFIRMLSNNKHRVISGISLINKSKSIFKVKHSVSYVKFMQIDEKFIKFYLDNNLWEGYAGGYAIQGIFSLVINNINGSYTNIVGLPVDVLYKILKDINFKFL